MQVTSRDISINKYCVMGLLGSVFSLSPRWLFSTFKRINHQIVCVWMFPLPVLSFIILFPIKPLISMLGKLLMFIVVQISLVYVHKKYIFWSWSGWCQFTHYLVQILKKCRLHTNMICCLIAWNFILLYEQENLFKYRCS